MHSRRKRLCRNAIAAEFVDALWHTPTPVGKWRYYDGMLYLLGFINVAGRFRVWLPGPAPVPPPSLIAALVRWSSPGCVAGAALT